MNLLLPSSPSLQSTASEHPRPKSHFATLNAKQSNMSNPQRASLTKQIPQQSAQDAAKRRTDMTSQEEVVVYKCTCGTPDTSEDWICCDDDDCPVGWYHLECVRLSEVPPGDWLCPRCSLKPLNKSRLLKQNSSVSSKLGKTTARDTHDTLDHHEKVKVKDKGTRPAKKGIAIKKSTPKKKAKWIEWVETDSHREEKHKGHEKAAQGLVVAAEGRNTKAHTIKSKSRVTRSQASTLNLAARLKRVMAESGRKE